MTEKSKQSKKALIAEIDREILALVEKRTLQLAEWNREDPLASMADHCRESLLHAVVPPEVIGTVDTGPTPRQRLADQVIPFLAGLTYQSAVQAQRVSYLGPEYSYSHSAAKKFFGADLSFQAVQTINAVFEEIHRRQSNYGVVPIENSTDGGIVDTLTMFIRRPTPICGEVLLPIHHNLLANCKREEIREVHSKPQALSQCRGWLNEHLPNARWVEVSSTAAAASVAAATPYVAAVASMDAGLATGLHVVAASIEDNPNNVTRFVIIGDECPEPTGNDKTSLMFQVPHKPGALADAMLMFRDNGLNLTWIESFPVPGSSNEYFFFVELDGHRLQPNVAKALHTLEQTAIRLDLMGSYPKAVAPPRP